VVSRCVRFFWGDFFLRTLNSWRLMISVFKSIIQIHPLIHTGILDTKKKQCAEFVSANCTSTNTVMLHANNRTVVVRTVSLHHSQSSTLCSFNNTSGSIVWSQVSLCATEFLALFSPIPRLCAFTAHLLTWVLATATPSAAQLLKG